MKNISLKIFMLIAILCGGIVSDNYAVFADNSNTVSEQYQTINSDMEDYIRLARRGIKNNWYPPVSSFEHSAKIAIKVDRNGQLLDCRVLESSNDDAFDASLINAAKKTSFKPLPVSYKRDNAELYLSFSMQKHHVSK